MGLTYQSFLPFQSLHFSNCSTSCSLIIQNSSLTTIHFSVETKVSNDAVVVLPGWEKAIVGRLVIILTLQHKDKPHTVSGICSMRGISAHIYQSFYVLDWKLDKVVSCRIFHF